MPTIDRLPRPARHILGAVVAPEFESTLPSAYSAGTEDQSFPQVVAVEADTMKAGELLLAAGLGPFQADTRIRVVADVEALPRKTRRKFKRGEIAERVIVTRREGRSLFRPFNPHENEITVNLTTLPQALSESAQALEENEQAVAAQNRFEQERAEHEEREPFVARSTRESLEALIQDEIDDGVIQETRRLAHARWHHRIRPLATGAVVGGTLAAVGRTVTGAVDGGIPPEHIPHTPLTWQGVATFLGGWALVGLYTRLIAHPRHAKKADKQTERYMQRHGEDRVVTFSIQRPEAN